MVRNEIKEPFTMLYELDIIRICDVLMCLHSFIHWKLGTQISLAKAPETTQQYCTRTWICSILLTVHHVGI